MSDRNWEQELAKIDKQLASVSDEQLLAQNNTTQRAPLTAPASGKSAPAAKASAPVAPARQPRSWIAWGQLTVAIAAGASLWFWPWATRCGLNAMTFTAATGAVTALGLWSAVGSWRHRQGLAHVLSFIVMVWGLVLGAREVLPRMGYAIPTVERPAEWGCEASTSLPAKPAALPTVTPPNASPGGAAGLGQPTTTVPVTTPPVTTSSVTTPPTTTPPTTSPPTTTPPNGDGPPSNSGKP